MIGARERLFGLAGELGDGEIGFEFGCSFVRGGGDANELRSGKLRPSVDLDKTPELRPRVSL